MKKKKSVLWPLFDNEKKKLEKNSIGVKIEEILDCREKQEVVAEVNREIVLIVAKWFFIKFGRNLEDYNARIPLQTMPENAEEKWFPWRLEIEKQCSDPVYILTKGGITSIRWCYKYDGEWIWELNKLENTSQKFITKKLHDQLIILVNKALLGILEGNLAFEIIDEDSWKILDIMFDEECNYFIND